MTASSRRGFAFRQWVLAVALVLLAASLWMPGVRLMRDRFDYVVTFDITQSMNVEDVMRDGVRTSRLVYAREAMRRALRRMPCGSRVGWSVFTGARSLMLLEPLEVCEHYDALTTSLDGIDGGMRWANASRIANGGLFSAIHQAKQMGGNVAVVFMTDGQEAPPRPLSDTSMPGITPGEVRGWLIGVGGDQPAPIPKTDSEGRPAGFWLASDVVQTSAMSSAQRGEVSHEELSALRGGYLKTLGGQTGLDYRALSSVEALGDALLDSRFAERVTATVDFRWCAALGAFVLLVVVFLPDFRGLRLRTRR